jgi:hypothetical protein
MFFKPPHISLLTKSSVIHDQGLNKKMLFLILPRAQKGIDQVVLELLTESTHSWNGLFYSKFFNDKTSINHGTFAPHITV